MVDLLPANDQKNALLMTATFPGTITGLRWDISAVEVTDIIDVVAWTIVVVRDGNSGSAMSVGNATNLYAPEQDVLAFGFSRLQGNDEVERWVGSTKTMRKLMGGDKLEFLCKNIQGATAHVSGCIQLFYKT